MFALDSGKLQGEIVWVDLDIFRAEGEPAGWGNKIQCTFLLRLEEGAQTIRHLLVFFPGDTVYIVRQLQVKTTVGKSFRFEKRMISFQYSGLPQGISLGWGQTKTPAIAG